MKPPENIQYRVIAKLGNLEWLHADYHNQSFARHTHDGYALGVIEQGCLAFSYRREQWLATPGSINLVIPGEAHDGYAATDTGWRYRMLYLSAAVMEQAAGEAVGKPVGLPYFSGGVIQDCELSAMIHAFHCKLENNSLPLLEQQSSLLLLLTRFIRRYAEDRRPLPHIGKENTAVNLVRDYIESHYATELSLQELSRLCHLSPFHLLRVFQRSIGLPPHAYLKQVRIAKAKQLLSCGISVSETAQQTGFADQSHLTRQFKQITGLTPAKYSSIVLS